MLLLGGYPPLSGFLGGHESATVRASGALPDGRPWPAPITLVVPGEVARAAVAAGSVQLRDEEGVPVAELVELAPFDVAEDRIGLGGTVRGVRPLERGGYRSLRRAAGGADGAGEPVLGVPVRGPLVAPDVAALAACARRARARVLLLPLTGYGSPLAPLDGPALVRSCLAVAPELDAQVLPVAVPRHSDDAVHAVHAVHAALGVHVAAAYGATHVPRPPGDARPAPAGLSLVDLPAVGLDRRTSTWQPLGASR
jgi:sulfate adenylyltransferase